LNFLFFLNEELLRTHMVPGEVWWSA